jgi:hypothetical protein
MSLRPRQRMPSTPFGLLLAEGGDEIAVCRVLAGSAGADLCCWNAGGRDLPNQARLALADPNFRFARSVGVVLDIEGDLAGTRHLAAETLAIFGATAPLVHGVLAGGPPRLGAFLSPDGLGPGSIETLCRAAVHDRALAACVDQLVGCAGSPHRDRANARVAEDKGWLKAYLGMLPEPDLRFHQAFVPGGIDADHAAFDALRAFVRSL